MNSIKHILLLFILVGILIAAQGQTTSAVFESDIPFTLSLSKKEQVKTFKSAIKIDGLKGGQRYKATFKFKNDSTLNTTIFILSEGFIHYYTVDHKKAAFKKAVPSIGNKENMEAVDFIKGEIETAKDTIADSTATDTAYVVPFKNYYRLADYTGRIGCPFPIKNEELNKLIDIANREDLEDEKLSKVQIVIQDMDSACVLISQTKTIIQLFEYEETKLSFAKFMYIYTFDIDNYFELYDEFNFDNSREELKQYVGTQIDNSNKTKNE